MPGDPNADPMWLLRPVRQAAQDWGLWPGAPASTAGPARDGRLVSDTGQLAWLYDDGYLTVDTPLTQGVLGRLGGRSVSLSTLHVAATTERCAISATALDGKPLSESRRVLVCAGGRAQNSDQRLRRQGFWLTVVETGVPPVLAEPVSAEIFVRRAPGAPALRAWSLSPSGRRTQPVPVRGTREGLSMRIGSAAPSIYYELAP
jgi:hypothetical protein